MYDDSDNYFSFAVDDVTPPVISSIAASSITSNSAVLTWTTNEAATQQVSYRSTSFSWQLEPENTTSFSTSHSFTLSNLIAGITYVYKVLSRDHSGNSTWSGESTFTIPAGNPPSSPPASVTASSATGKISVSWTTANAAKYTIYRSANNSSYQIWATNITNTSFDDLYGGGVNQGVTYRYKVYSCNSDGATCSSSGTESNSVTYTGGDVSCTGLNLTLNDGKTTYTIGVDHYVNYTWTCTPGGPASYVAMWLQKPDGSSKFLGSTSGSVPTQTSGLPPSEYTPGTYVLKACFDPSCATINASQTFTLVSGSVSTATGSNLAAVAMAIESLREILQQIQQLISGWSM